MLNSINSSEHFRVFCDSSVNEKLSWVCWLRCLLCRPALFPKRPIYIGLDSLAQHVVSASLCQEADSRLCQPDLYAHGPQSELLGSPDPQLSTMGSAAGRGAGPSDDSTPSLCLACECECVQTLGMQTFVRRYVQKYVYVMSAFAHICMYLYRLRGSVCPCKCVKGNMYMCICVCDCGYRAAFEA